MASPLAKCRSDFTITVHATLEHFYRGLVFPAALVATTGSGGVRGEDASGVDVEHPCGGSAVVERPTAVTVQSTVKAEHVSRLLTRALHTTSNRRSFSFVVCKIPSPVSSNPLSRSSEC